MTSDPDPNNQHAYPVEVQVSQHAQAIERIGDCLREYLNATGGDPKQEVAQGLKFWNEDEGPNAKVNPEALRAMLARKDAIEIWQEMSLRLVGWAFFGGFVTELELNPGIEPRRRLSRALSGELLRKPTIWPDFSLVVLPRSVAKELDDALLALEYGETQSILRPRKVAGRRMNHSLEDLEEAALLVVHFRYGSGETKTDAIAAVAEAYGVAPETVRQWEKKQSDVQRELNRVSALAGAQKAGLTREAALRRSKLDWQAKNRRAEIKSSREEWEEDWWGWAENMNRPEARARLDLAKLAQRYKQTKRDAKSFG
jgi:hypothetical protein